MAVKQIDHGYIVKSNNDTVSTKPRKFQCREADVTIVSGVITITLPDNIALNEERTGSICHEIDSGSVYIWHVNAWVEL